MIFYPGRAFHAAGDVDAIGSHHPNRFGNILWSKPAREDQGYVAEPSLMVGKACPRNRLTSSAISTGCKGVNKDGIRKPARCIASFKIFSNRGYASVVNPTSPDDEAIRNLSKKRGRFVAMQLNRHELIGSDKVLNHLRICIDEYADSHHSRWKGS